jgi:hypothetical protein
LPLTRERPQTRPYNQAHYNKLMQQEKMELLCSWSSGNVRPRITLEGAHNGVVAGSSPAWPTNIFNGLRLILTVSRDIFGTQKARNWTNSD